MTETPIGDAAEADLAPVADEAPSQGVAAGVAESDGSQADIYRAPGTAGYEAPTPEELAAEAEDDLDDEDDDTPPADEAPGQDVPTDPPAEG